MSNKNKFNKLFLALMLIILIVMLTSCLRYVPEEEGLKEEAGIIITINDTKEQDRVVTIVNITENVSEEQLEEKEEQGEQEEKEEEKQEEQIPVRASEVEFYFLLKGKSFFRHILKENQVKTYNMSGYLVSIEPIIITQDSVKFRINNFTTKTLQEDDSDSTQEFEIIVKDIYYRR